MFSRLVAISLLAACVCAYPKTNQVQTYLSRPDLTPPKFEFTVFDSARVSSGYILMTPFTTPTKQYLHEVQGGVPEVEKIEAERAQNGPYIFSKKGDLVYSGYGSAGGEFSQNLKLVEYDGQPHLSFVQDDDNSRGVGVIMDGSYQVIKNVHASNGRAGSDPYEFTVLRQGTALVTVSQPTPYDLTRYGIDQPVGWVTQSIFQEVEIETGKVLFEWKSLDHVDLSESYNRDNKNVLEGANGTSPFNAYDYFHINSIDRFSNGDYLISSRHTCALYRLDARTGKILWQLGGKKNQFKLKGFTAPFAFQNHARIHSRNETTIIISLFDNGFDGVITRSVHSSGMVMAVDTRTMTCTLLHQYYLPRRVSSIGGGSVQLLDNSNVFVGWGSMPYISEFTEQGHCVMAAQFAAEGTFTMNWRAVKIDKWVGRPDWSPAIASYANKTSSPTEIYTSWNGATEVATWRFYGGHSNWEAHMTVLGTTAKEGFETSFTADKYYAWTRAEALDRQGNCLGKTPVQQTYVRAS